MGPFVFARTSRLLCEGIIRSLEIDFSVDDFLYVRVQTADGTHHRLLLGVEFNLRWLVGVEFDFHWNRAWHQIICRFQSVPIDHARMDRLIARFDAEGWDRDSQ